MCRNSLISYRYLVSNDQINTFSLYINKDMNKPLSNWCFIFTQSAFFSSLRHLKSLSPLFSSFFHVSYLYVPSGSYKICIICNFHAYTLHISYHLVNLDTLIMKFHMWVQNHLFTFQIVCYMGFTLKPVSIFHFLGKDKNLFLFNI